MCFNLERVNIGLAMTTELRLSEQDHQIHEAVRQAVDIIDATAVQLGEPRTPTGVALELLRQDKLPFVTKAAALFVRTRELIKQNPSRPR